MAVKNLAWSPKKYSQGFKPMYIKFAHLSYSDFDMIRTWKLNFDCKLENVFWWNLEQNSNFGQKQFDF